MINKVFSNLLTNADGKKRAHVTLKKLDTLWFNTGSLCNISCKGCYIESSPTNKKIEYITLNDVKHYIEQILDLNLGTKLIGFTGGEPFLNPSIIDILDFTLVKNFKVLLLTNAMKPMINKSSKLIQIKNKKNLTIRVSMDHYTAAQHELIRGKNSWIPLINGLKWLHQKNFNIDLACRILEGENELDMRKGFQELIKKLSLNIDAFNPSNLVIFPEMKINALTPEISEDCWSVIDKSKDTVMCSNSRMVVKKRDNPKPVILSCTLITNDKDFELGNNFKTAKDTTYLKHPYCSQFCVLGNSKCAI